MRKPNHLFRILSLLAIIASPGTKSATPPNVVFMVSDDLSAEALGCYGNAQAKTPHLDRLAGESVRFTGAYCQFPVCGPSRASFMSGQYPSTTGILSNGASDKIDAVFKNHPSLAQTFKNHGYRTTRVSKIYHMRIPGDITAGVSGPDHAASWTETHNCPGKEWYSDGEASLPTNQRVNRDTSLHYNLGFGGAFQIIRTPSDGPAQPDELASTKAAEVIRNAGTNPFFLAVGFIRPHVPLVAPQPWFALHPMEQVRLPELLAGDWDDIPKAGISLNSKGLGIADKPGNKREILGAYNAAVTFMDHQVGQVLKALDETGHRSNTIVVFISDHGYHLGEHDFWQKMSLHEESTRVPLLISAPGKKPGVASGLVELIDLYPTLTELAGLPPSPGCEGRSLVPQLDDPGAPGREVVQCWRGKDRLFRTPSHAYIRYGNGEEEWYDMKNDPLQRTNLAGKDPAALESFRARWSRP